MPDQETKTPKLPVVLTADDDENSHLMLQLAFKKRGVKVILQSVNDGVEAIKYLTGEGRFADRELFPLPNLLLLDWKMPLVGGEGVLEFLGSNPSCRSFPVVVFSSSNVDRDIEKAYALGCDAYVVKPTSFDKLLDLASALAEEILDGRKSTVGCLKGIALQVRSMIVQERPRDLKPREKEGPALDMFQLLVEQVKDYAIFMLDVDGMILSWNDGARRIKGYEAHEVIGRHFSIFYPQSDLDFEKPIYELRMAREMGRYEEEGWRIRKDGSRFWANVIVTPMYEPSGKLTGFAKVTRDLTQRKLQEDNLQRLLESEERFRLLVDQVKDYAIFMLDARGHIASWNQGARRLKGYTTNEVLGKHISLFYTPEDINRDHPSRELSIAIQEGRYEEEGWRVKKDGSRFWANVVITALWDKRGNLTGFAKVTRDLTIRKQQEDALLRRTEELEAFAHTLSHDLRAPLRSIASFAQIMQEESTSLSGNEKSYLGKIISAAHAMDTLISDILKLSQVSLSPVTEKPVSLDGILKEALAMHESEIIRTGANIDIRGPLPFVRGSPTLLVQIFSNLLQNALKFVAPGKTPQVHIYAEEHEGICHVHVKDRGLGVPGEMQDKIFKVFERGSAGRNIGGSGVGLAIVKKAAERLGGSIRLLSEEGQGSDFIFTIPGEAITAAVVSISA